MPTVYTDTYAGKAKNALASCSNIAPVVLSDSDDLAFASVCILASADCTIKATTLGGQTVTAYPLQKGYNDVRLTRIWSTGTTLGGATLFALW